MRRQPIIGPCRSGFPRHGNRVATVDASQASATDREGRTGQEQADDGVMKRAAIVAAAAGAHRHLT